MTHLFESIKQMMLVKGWISLAAGFVAAAISVIIGKITES